MRVIRTAISQYGATRLTRPKCHASAARSRFAALRLPRSSAPRVRSVTDRPSASGPWTAIMARSRSVTSQSPGFRAAGAAAGKATEQARVSALAAVLLQTGIVSTPSHSSRFHARIARGRNEPARYRAVAGTAAGAEGHHPGAPAPLAGSAGYRPQAPRKFHPPARSPRSVHQEDGVPPAAWGLASFCCRLFVELLYNSPKAG